MKSLNRATLLGNLGQNPEVVKSTNGRKIVTFSVATNEKWVDEETKEQKERTDWHDVKVFGILAELCGQFLKAGAPVYIEGKLRKEKWKDSQNREHTRNYVYASDVNFLGVNPANVRTTRPIIPIDVKIAASTMR